LVVHEQDLKEYLLLTNGSPSGLWASILSSATALHDHDLLKCQTNYTKQNLVYLVYTMTCQFACTYFILSSWNFQKKGQTTKLFTKLFPWVYN